MKVRMMLRKCNLVVIDIFLLMATYTFTVAIFRLIGMQIDVSEALLTLIPIIMFKLISFGIFGFYRMMSAHVGFEDIMKIILVITGTNIIVLGVFYFLGASFIHPLALVFITPIEVVMMALPRVTYKLLYFFKNQLTASQHAGKRTLIIGAGDGGELVLKEIYRNKALKNTPVAFLDDDKAKIGKTLLGVKIIGPINKIEDFITEYNIQEVIIAIADLSQKRLKTLVEIIAENNVKIKRLPLMHEMELNKAKKVIDVEVEDLLDRDEITLDTEGIQDLIEGQTILITGGGGSIGSELARQIVSNHPKHLIIFDIYENNAYEIQTEIEALLRKKTIQLKLDVIIGSVYDQSRVQEIFAHYRPTMVFHAAAYKHVPLMEKSPKEAVRTNVIGTYFIAEACAKFNVKQMVLISSDKAVRPTNIMGATKRYAELIVEDFNAKSTHTKYASVRFGNVLGSNGSVIPLFKKQIESGGPITVTHKDITRYFMTIPEAVSLILECSLYSKGGEIFILDMGEPVKIKQLAKNMIKLAGLKEGEDIDIIYTGLRAGEKLYEELLLDTTKDKVKTANDKIFIETDVKNGDTPALEELLEIMSSCKPSEMKSIIAKHIHSYQVKR